MTISDGGAAAAGIGFHGIGFHGRRRGRPLRPRRRRLLTEVLPTVSIDLSRSAELIDPRDLFGKNYREVWLEIGFGAGEHMLAQAIRHPSVAIIGCEPFQNGVASMLDRLDRAGLVNIRVFADDSRLLLKRLPRASIDRAFALFPDPWPKRKHWKRRLFSASSWNLLASALKVNARLHLATDHQGYLASILAEAVHQADFKWLARRPDDWRNPWDDWQPTRYQLKALQSRAVCTYLTFAKC